MVLGCLCIVLYYLVNRDKIKPIWGVQGKESHVVELVAKDRENNQVDHREDRIVLEQSNALIRVRLECYQTLTHTQ